MLGFSSDSSSRVNFNFNPGENSTGLLKVSPGEILSGRKPPQASQAYSCLLAMRAGRANKITRSGHKI
jgi:hypothetical protein